LAGASSFSERTLGIASDDIDVIEALEDARRMLERFLGQDYMPHGHCYFWEPGLVWLHLFSDLGVFLAYAAIPGFLAVLIKQRDDLGFRRLLWLFVGFIVLCGLTHLMGAITIWHPFYRTEGVLKALTAVISVVTAVALYRALPVALAIPSRAALHAEVSQRRSTEDKLRAELSRQQATLTALTGVVLEIAVDRNVKRMTGAPGSAPSPNAQPADDPWARQVALAIADTLDEANDVGVAHATRLQLRDEHGAKLDYAARVVAMEGGGWVVSVDDVSDEVRLIESLRASREILEQFVYTASHDLRSPLRAVTQLSLWLEEDLGPRLEGENLEHLRALRSRVQRMDDMLSGLIRFSRAGQAMDDAAEIDLQAVLDGILEHELSDEAAGRPTSGFTVRAEGALPTLRTVRAPLERVLANLVTNAVRHHDRDQGTVIVRANDESAHQVTIEVEDDGPGIEPRHQERIFQLFQTLVPKDRKESSGMGLAVARRTVLSLGGSIEVESPIRDGRGTLFRVKWPRVLRRPLEVPPPVDR